MGKKGKWFVFVKNVFKFLIRVGDDEEFEFKDMNFFGDICFVVVVIFVVFYVLYLF